MISVIFKNNDYKRSYLANEGNTILEVARKYNIQIEGAFLVACFSEQRFSVIFKNRLCSN